MLKMIRNLPFEYDVLTGNRNQYVNYNTCIKQEKCAPNCMYQRFIAMIMVVRLFIDVCSFVFLGTKTCAKSFRFPLSLLGVR